MIIICNFQIIKISFFQETRKKKLKFHRVCVFGGKTTMIIMLFDNRMWPDYVLAHNNLATLLENREEGLHHLRMALNIDPWHPNSLYNMAVLHR